MFRGIWIIMLTLLVWAMWWWLAALAEICALWVLLLHYPFMFNKKEIKDWEWVTKNLPTFWPLCVGNVTRYSAVCLYPAHTMLSRVWRWQVTDGRVVRAGFSVTWDVLSWSGGHEFENRVGRPSLPSRTWTKNIIEVSKPYTPSLTITCIYSSPILSVIGTIYQETLFAEIAGYLQKKTCQLATWTAICFNPPEMYIVIQHKQVGVGVNTHIYIY